MNNQIKKIGVLTSGGDAPGMNAAIRGIVRSALAENIEVIGFRRGYEGLINSDYINLDSQAVSDIMSKGGTILLSARCKEMMTDEGKEKAINVCKKLGIDALIVIGGDGSLSGALSLSKLGLKVMGIPGTIDLDLACSDYTIGFDTAVNTAMEAIDKLRDTSESHERCSVVEVMGRTAGHIALWTGIASGAEYILTTEKYHGDIQRIISKIQDRRKLGKKNHIIVNAEGVGNSAEMAKIIEVATGVETRATILGHIQRGGNPTCKDRVFASAMGTMAVELLCEGKSNRVVGYKEGEFVDFDIQEALSMSKDLDPYLFHITHKLTTR